MNKNRVTRTVSQIMISPYTFSQPARKANKRAIVARPSKNIAGSQTVRVMVVLVRMFRTDPEGALRSGHETGPGTRFVLSVVRGYTLGYRGSQFLGHPGDDPPSVLFETLSGNRTDRVRHAAIASCPIDLAKCKSSRRRLIDFWE
jgi:hypothetical protein